jgi:hypothetical protein
LDDEVTEVDEAFTLDAEVEVDVEVEVEVDVELEVPADDEFDVAAEALAFVADMDEDEAPGIV